MSLTKVKKSVLDIESFIGGADGQVQFNDSNDFGVDANFTYNASTHVLSVSGISLAGNMVVGSSLIVGAGGIVMPVGAFTSILYPSDLVGMIAAFPIESPPPGWLECDGSSQLKASYEALHSIIGYSYGGSVANFNLPDYRGYFLRGWDNGAGNDPDAGTRIGVGSIPAGDNVGTSEDEAFKSHAHSGVPGLGGGANSAAAGSALYPSTTANTDTAGGSETRPKNISVMYCIKT